MLIIYFSESQYYKIDSIIIKNNIVNLTNYNYKNYNTYNTYYAVLINNKTCQIKILNQYIIQQLKNYIENYNYDYYTNIDLNNICSTPQTFLMIFFSKILINISFIFLSFVFTLLFVNLLYEIKDNYKKNDDIVSNKHNTFPNNDDIISNEKRILFEV